MDLLTDRYQKEILGTLSCFDRVVITGTLPLLCYAQGMTGYLYQHDIKIFNYADYTKPFNTAIRDNAERLARENGIEIEFIRKSSIRKEDLIQQKLADWDKKSGLVHILSAMESCSTYKPWHDKHTHKTYLKSDTSRCLHYYFYFMDDQFGLCYIRVPTWCPFRLQIYFNGHNWLAHKLDHAGISYQLRDNAFVRIDDFDRAQEIADNFTVKELHDVLDRFATLFCPVHSHFNQVYHWSVMQAEYATDIVFKEQKGLQSIYDRLIKTAMHTVTPDQAGSFLGKPGVHGNYEGEVGSRYHTRIEGRIIKHHMGDAAIKMYDKFGQVLRIETTTNNISFFKH